MVMEPMLSKVLSWLTPWQHRPPFEDKVMVMVIMLPMKMKDFSSFWFITVNAMQIDGPGQLSKMTKKIYVKWLKGKLKSQMFDLLHY